MSQLSDISETDPDAAPTCCVALRPGIILRNLMLPEDMWDSFPKGLSYSITDYFLYQPGYPAEVRRSMTMPDCYSLPYEEVWIRTKDGVKLHAFLIMVKNQEEEKQEKMPTIIFFHGNAGNIGDRIRNAKMIYEEMNCNTLLVQYRGFGRSQGTPSEKGLYRDARAAFEYVYKREDLDSNKIFLYGHSLGGAVAIDLASRSDFRHRVAGLIVENTFTNIPDLAKHLFPFKVVKYLPKFCFKNRYESGNKISSVVCPTLIIRGDDDEMIPETMLTDLHSKCSSQLKRLDTFEGGDHNDTWLCDGYAARVSDFITLAVRVGDKGRGDTVDASSNL